MSSAQVVGTSDQLGQLGGILSPVSSPSGREMALPSPLDMYTIYIYTYMSYIHFYFYMWAVGM
jgi:hypothetical protein